MIIIFFEVFKNSLLITVFVFVMMLLLDYINVLTKGKMNQILKVKGFRQYILSSFLGVTPGCLGTFMAVSLYTHGLLSFGALTSCMITTSGDESFVMLSIFPKKAIFIFAILFVIGIISGWLADRFVLWLKIKELKCPVKHIHFEEKECKLLNFKEIIFYFKNISLQKFLLLTLLVISIYAGLAGFVIKEWGWERITLCLLLLITIVIVLTVPEHYLQEHIWEHLIRKHLWRIFLWTFFALFIIKLGSLYWNLKEFIKHHMVFVLLIAVLVGIIPESGPHLVFVFMFKDKMIPFSVFLASCIVQDGHGMLPLLAHNLKISALVKLFNIIVGLSIGFILYYLGW